MRRRKIKNENYSIQTNTIILFDIDKVNKTIYKHDLQKKYTNNFIHLTNENEF